MKTRYRLKLFVCGLTSPSEQAVACVRRLLLEQEIECDLTIVDVLNRPELAEADAIATTPALLKESPAPRQLFAGDFSDHERVLAALGIRTEPKEGTAR